MKKIPLPQHLQQHREEIVHVFDNARGSGYSPARWREYFRNDPRASNDLTIITERCPRRIKRDDVKHFAGKARSGGYDDLRRLFLASMIWGWGRGGKWKEGLKNTEAALSDPTLRQMLESAAERIKKTQIEEAYTGFKLKGCRRAFFTKFFYFVGQEWGVSPLPLILDSYVEKFLGCLGEEEGWNKSTFKNAQGYVQYVTSMDEWARQLACPADCIEYFMFKQQKGKTGPKERGREDKVPNLMNSRDRHLLLAVAHCHANNLDAECQMIQNMVDSPNWRVPSARPRGAMRQGRFKRAWRGNFIILWRVRGAGIPQGWNVRYDPTDPACEREMGYWLQTPEGRAWYQRNNLPVWIPNPPPAQPSATAHAPLVLATLAPEERTKLDELAKKYGVAPETLARIWVLEHLG